MPSTKERLAKQQFLLLLCVFLSIVGILVTLTLIRQSQDTRQKAATSTGIATLTLPASKPVTAGTQVTLPLKLNTKTALVIGAQVYVDVTGAVPSSLTYVPQTVNGLTTTITDVTPISGGKRFTIGMITSNPSSGFSTQNGEVTVGNFQFTSGSTGQVVFNFNPTTTKVLDAGNDTDILKTPVSYTYQMGTSATAIPQPTTTARPVTPRPVTPRPVTPAPTATSRPVTPRPTTPSPTARPTTPSSGTHSVNFQSIKASLVASDFTISANGLNFYGTQNVAVHSDPGSSTYTTLEMVWTEHSREMRLFIYFAQAQGIWRVTEVRTYDGKNPGNWLFYAPNDAGGAVGSPLVVSDLILTSKDGQGKIQVKNLNLSVNFSGTSAVTPRPQTPSPTPQGLPICLNITRDVALPQPGQQVRFTCGQISGATRYEFRYRILETGETNAIGTISSSSNISQPLTMKAGTYDAECRVCIGNSCSQFSAW